ncbi:glycosyltransferase family 4 protein [Vibrio parahaemolyticus]|nr:glycosyltransferase family 4 protein [Vibrio parahaemolyticus]EJG1633342.1 glycosyltransferase family 4 protein [Vibrio parahaemolyticus]ELA7161824.1 glycosyltransferase family 4 protein [Vibrio parahaemolyticus]
MNKTALVITDIRNNIKSGGVKTHTLDVIKFLSKTSYKVDVVVEGHKDINFIRECSKFSHVTHIPHRMNYFGNNVLGFLGDYLVSRKVRKIKYNLVITNTGDVTKYWYLNVKSYKRLHIVHSLFSKKISFKNFIWKINPPKINVVTVSEFANNLLRNNTGLKDISTIHNYSQLDFEKGIDGNNECITILTVGQLVSYKGVEDWKRVSEEIATRHRNVKFIWVGDGPHIPVIESRLRDRIILAGFQSNVEPFYRSADVYYHPSHLENHSLSILDALAKGLPIIACDVGGNAESVDASVGELVEKGDTEAQIRALEKIILSDKERFKKSEQAIIKKNKLFSKDIWEINMSRLIGD